MTSPKHLSPDDTSAYQRWEPAPLDSAALQQVRLTTAEAVEQIHQQAHQEGYDAGFNEGMSAGYQKGQAQAADELRRLRTLITGVEAATQQFSQAVGEQVLAVALDVARQMLRQALNVKPELLLPILRSVMESLPQHTQHPHLHLHPEDAALVRAQMQAEIAQGGWKIIEDARVARGGCRIETSTAEIDATLPNRWQLLATALGQDVSWLDQ